MDIGIKNKLFAILLILSLFACNEQNKKEKDAASRRKAQQLGEKVVKISFSHLKGRLKNAMQSGGVQAAFSVCNVEALKLTDSLSNALHVTIKRTSHKVRNPKNAPDDWEKKVLQTFLKQKEQGKQLKPIVEKQGNYWRYAQAIEIKPQCLLCHGQIAGDVKKLVAQYYPQDQAVGFQEGDLRGMWSIKIPTQNIAQ